MEAPSLGAWPLASSVHPSVRLRVFVFPGRVLTTSVEFPPSLIGNNNLLFQSGLLVTIASVLPNPTSFKGQVKILSLWGKSPSNHLYRDLALSYTCPLPFLGLFSFLFFPPSDCMMPHSPLPGKGMEQFAHWFFMHSRERALQQECWRQDTSRPFLTTFHEFTSLILMDSKYTAE